MRIYFLFLAYLLFIAFEGSTEEAPADPLLLTTVLVIEGKVFLESGSVNAPAGLKATINNERLNLSQTVETDENSRYNITFFDPLQPVAQLGDELKITIDDSAGGIEETNLVLTLAHIKSGRVSLDLKTALLARANRLQINGKIYLSDGVSGVGQGLKVSVKINKLVQETTTNHDGYYSLTLTNQIGFLASTGDTILAYVEPYQNEIVTVPHTLSSTEVASGRLDDLHITTQLQQPVELILTENSSIQPIVSPVVAFKDPNLERALRNQITANAMTQGNIIPGSRLTEYHLAQLTELKAIDLSIFDLAGLSNCINLQRLNLSLNKITDLSIIGKIPTLTHLSLDNNQIKDLTPLSKLTNLVFLSLNGNQIGNLLPLQQTNQLENLYCSHNQITDLSALVNLKQLTTLTLTGNYNRKIQLRLSDINPLTQLINLKRLKLGANTISDLTPLAKLLQLVELDLSRNYLTDIAPLSSLIQIRQLNLSHNYITDIRPLSHLPQVTNWLDLSNNSIRHIRPLRDSLISINNQTQKSTGQIWLTRNPLNNVSVTHDLKQLQLEGLQVIYLDRIPDDIILIVRPDIESRVRSALSESSQIEQLTPSNVVSITDLDFSALGLAEVDIGFLKNFLSLKSLKLSGNPLNHTTIQTQVSEIEKLGVTVDFGIKGIGDIFVQASETNILAHPQSQTSVAITVKDKNGQPINTALVLVKSDRGRVDSPATNVGGGNYVTHFYGLNDPGLAHLTVEIGNLPPNIRSKVGRTSLVLSPVSVSSQKSIFKASRLETAKTGEVIRLFVKLTSSDGMSLPNRKVRLTAFPPEGISVNGYTPTDKYGRTTILLTPSIPGKKIIQAFCDKVQLESEVHINVTGEEIRKPVVGSAEKVTIELSKSTTWADGTSVVDIKITVLDGNGQGLPNQLLQLILGSCNEHKPSSVFKDLSSCQPIASTQKDEFGQLNPAQDSFDGNYYTTYKSGFQPGKIQITATTDNGRSATETLRLESPADQPNYFFLSQLNDNVYQNQIFETHIRVSNGSGLVSWKLNLEYDADKLAIVSVEEGDFLKKTQSLFQPGRLKSNEIIGLGATSLDPRASSGSGTLATVTFHALRANQETEITTIQVSQLIITNNNDQRITSSTLIEQHIKIMVADECDVNLDGKINIFDLIMVAEKLEHPSIGENRLDVNKDGLINLTDLILIGQKFGQSSSAPAIFNTDLLIAQWIQLANAKLPLISDTERIMFRSGILNLGQIQKEKKRPIKTRLLTNYPNPFNPSTWIPFQLGHVELVTLNIYDVEGQLVRKIDLGCLIAGNYAQPDRAIYWDGQTENGELVSSGTYFYQLQAGDYRETRKMVILK